MGTEKTLLHYLGLTAQHILGQCYSDGNGVVLNKEEATRWFRLAADQGFARAQIRLGMCYLIGEGIAQDQKEGLRWIRLAAEQGFAAAQYFLGDCYYNGKGFVQDKKEAYFWWLLAAANGDKDSQRSIGIVEKEFNTREREQIQTRARKWFEEHRITQGMNLL